MFLKLFQGTNTLDGYLTMHYGMELLRHSMFEEAAWCYTEAIVSTNDEIRQQKIIFVYISNDMGV